MNDRTIPTKFKCRSEEMESIRQNCLKHHTAIIFALLSTPYKEKQNVEDAEIIVKAFFKQFFIVKAINYDLFVGTFHSELQPMLLHPLIVI